MKFRPLNLKHEWYWILGVCLASLFAFIAMEPESVVTLAWVSLFCGWAFMFYVGYYGWSAKRLRKGLSTDEDTVGMHRAFVAVMTGAILIGVIGIEVAVRKVGGQWGEPWFLDLHLSLVTFMTVSFGLARFFYTGISNARSHRECVYLFAFFYAATLITGTMLIRERFPGFLWGI